MFSKYGKEPQWVEALMFGFFEQGQIDTDKIYQNIELSNTKIHDWGESDARLWESVNLISEIMRTEGYGQYEDVHVMERCISDKAENHLIGKLFAM